MRKVLGQMDMTAANNRENIPEKAGETGEKAPRMDRQFIKLYEDFNKQLVSEEQFRMLSTILNRKRKKQPKKLKTGTLQLTIWRTAPAKRSSLPMRWRNVRRSKS